MKKYFVGCLIAALALSAITLNGCTKKPTTEVKTINNDDPWESYNRHMFGFDQGFDKVFIRPFAVVYSKVTPPPLQQGVTNFFNNTFEITTFPNDLLQGNFKYMVVDFWRFVINTSFGVGGLFDVATKMGIKPHIETFGLTLAKWRGGKSAPYFVVPVFGPSTIQGAIGMGVDAMTTPWPYFNSNYVTYIPPAIGLISLRAGMLPADKLVANAFDPYVFVRDAYMQREKQRIAANEKDVYGKESQ